jgi:hypothetical protein
MAAPTYTPKTWHLIIVAMIVVLDLIVLYMVVEPNVTDDYRAYYIDRSASCFPRADNVATGYYPLGEPITFVPDRNGYGLDTVRWCGFMPPSNTGIRSFGDYGMLRIKMPLPDDDFLLTFTSWANTDSSKPERDVQVLVNDTRVGTLEFATAKRIDGKFLVPQVVARGGGKDDSGNDIVTIKFMVPRTGAPGTNSEPVTLQLRLESMRFAPLKSIAAEMAVRSKPVERPASPSKPSSSTPSEASKPS